MGIDHGRTDVLMPKEFLDRPDIVAVLKQLGGKGMPEGVTTGRLGDPGFPDGLFDSPLQDGVNVSFERPQIGFALFFLPLPRAYFVRTEIVRAPAFWVFRHW